MEEENRQQLWLTDLPSEILTSILDNLNRIQLSQLLFIGKEFYSLAQYLLENRKKIRLCGDHSRVLVLALPYALDTLALNSQKSTNVECSSRTGLLVSTFFSEQPTLEIEPKYGNFIKARERVTSRTVENGAKQTRITLIEPPMASQYRLHLYTLATTVRSGSKFYIRITIADICVLVVDPEEIDAYAEDIKEMIFGCCFMMSARNIIVAIDLSNVTAKESSGLCNGFNQAKLKISKLLNKTVGTCYTIIPINARTGTNITANITPKYEWFSGASLKKLILDDQLRTNFDESAYKKLCEAPLKLQLTNIHKILGIGTVIEGRVISGTIQRGDTVVLHPLQQTKVWSVETYGHRIEIAKPGDVVGANVNNVTKRNHPAKFTYVAKYPTVICTIAFRAQIAVMKPDRFAQRQVYKVFYGSARIPCMVWWIFPTDEVPKKARKFKLERTNWPVEPTNENNQINRDEYERLLKQYQQELEQARQQFAKFQKESGSGFTRPPRDQHKKVTAILLPLIHYDIVPYKPSEFEKNYDGKLMIMEKRKILGVGRVDGVICNPERTFHIQDRKDIEYQIREVINRAGSLFKLPQEQKLLDRFLAQKPTKVPIHKEKGELRMQREYWKW